MAAALAVLAGAGIWTASGAGGTPAVHQEDRVMEMPGAKIDTSYFTAGDAKEKRPAVLLGHGFGGSKDDVRGQARGLAREGFAC